MPDNPNRAFNRRISTTLPTKAGDVARPRVDEVIGRSIFDRRYMSWRLVNPNHPQAHDAELDRDGRWPRQQADQSCNLLQLYEHIEYYAIESQTEYSHYGSSRVLMMPNQEITPESGWFLYDNDTDSVYTVKEVLVSKDQQRRSTFDGRILLSETEGPPEGHRLSWIDPYGEKDEKIKVIRVIHKEEVRPLIATRSAQGDTADVTSTPFMPVIGYSMVRREPASVSNHPFGPAREIKPRIRMTVRDPDNPDLTQKVWGQWYDCIIQFQVYALGPKIADRISVWLEHFFMRYNRVLMQLGVQQVLPWSMRRDDEEERAIHDLSVRSVEIYFRMEDIQVEVDGQIKGYSLKITVSNDSDPAPWFTSEPELPRFSTDTSGAPLFGGPDIGDDY